MSERMCEWMLEASISIVKYMIGFIVYDRL